MHKSVFMAKLTQRSAIYVKIIELFHVFQAHSTAVNVNSIEANGATFKRGTSSESIPRLKQEIVLADTTLWSRCTSSEWHLVGRIMNELYEYNGLWLCTAQLKRNNTLRKALLGLIDKKVVMHTETPDIYLVNPMYIRRGEPFTILATMASMLYGVSKVTTDHLRHCKPVRERVMLDM